MAIVTVKLRKTFELTVEIDDPDVTDEIEWYDTVENLAWEKADGWVPADEEVVSVSGGRFG